MGGVWQLPQGQRDPPSASTLPGQPSSLALRPRPRPALPCSLGKSCSLESRRRKSLEICSWLLGTRLRVPWVLRPREKLLFP